MQDYGYNFTKTRRRSNSFSQSIDGFKTKFEGIENDPVFEEELHGPTEGGDEDEHVRLEKAESMDTTSTASVEEDDQTKK